MRGSNLIDTDRRAWSKVSRYIQIRDGHQCQLRVSPLCKGYSECTDHIVPRDLGGDDSEENLQAACYPCNRYKGAGHVFLRAAAPLDASQQEIPPLTGDYTRKHGPSR